MELRRGTPACTQADGGSGTWQCGILQRTKVPKNSRICKTASNPNVNVRKKIGWQKKHLQTLCFLKEATGIMLVRRQKGPRGADVEDVACFFSSVGQRATPYGGQAINHLRVCISHGRPSYHIIPGLQGPVPFTNGREGPSKLRNSIKSPSCD